jgi:integrase
MGITYDDKSKSYIVRIRRRGVKVARSFKRKGDAEAFENEKLRQIRDQADFGKKERHTLAAGVEKYVLDEVKNHRSAEKTESNVRAILPHISGLYLDQIDEAAKRVKASVRTSRRAGGKFLPTDKIKPLKPASINRRLAILRRVANLAYTEWHWLERPIAVRLLAEHNKRHEYLEPKEIQALSDAAREPVNHWVMVASYSGIRRGEMFRVDETSIRDGNVFLGLTKNGKPILLPIIPKFKEALAAWVKADKPDPRTMHKYFKAAAKKIGRPDLNPHDMRHTTASLLLNAGYGLETVAEVLNCTIANAQRYAHLSLKNKRNAMQNISKAKQIGVKLTVNKKLVTRKNP